MGHIPAGNAAILLYRVNLAEMKLDLATVEDTSGLQLGAIHMRVCECGYRKLAGLSSYNP
jgi:hypothetical protein